MKIRNELHGHGFRWWASITLLIFCQVLSAQNYDVLNFNASQGLNRGRINCLALDQEGILWVGANSGLMTFNGQAFESVSSLNYSGAIPNQYIHDIQVAKNGEIFVSYDKVRISMYNPNLRNFNELVNKNGTPIKTAMRPNLQIAENESLFIGDWRGNLDRYNTTTLESESIPTVEQFLDILKSKKTDGYYISTDQLMFYDNSTDKIELKAAYGGLLLTENSKGDIYSVKINGKDILKYNLETGEQTVFSERSRQGSEINSLVFFDSLLWVGTTNGLERYKEDGSKVEFRNEELGSFFSDKAITTFLADSSGSLWIAHDKGLSYVFDSEALFQSLNSNFSKDVTDIDKLNQDEFFICNFSESNGSIWNKNTKEIRQLIFEDKPSEVTNLFYSVSTKKGLWLFFLNGIFFYDFETEKLERYSPGGKFDYLQESIKKEVAVDFEGNIFVYNFYSSLYTKFSPDGTSIDTFKAPISDTRNPGVTFAFDAKSDLFLNTDNSIIKKDFKTAEWETIIPDLKAAGGSSTLYDKIYVQDSALWNISFQGDLELFEMTEQGIKYKKYGENEGILSNCLDILATEDGVTILLTQTSLCYKKSNSELFFCVDSEDGLLSLERNTSLRLFNDTLFILSKGIQFVRLSDLVLEREAPNVVLRNLTVNNHMKIPSEVLDLSADENNITIEVETSGIQFNTKKFFRYRLDEDDSWTLLPSGSKHINFSELAPNTYKLQISSRTHRSPWGEIIELDIKIRPEWWASFFGVFGIASLIASVFYLLLRWRFRNRQELSRMETRIAELENTALRAQMNPHFIFNSLNSIKSYIIKNNREEAADYLTSFSELIRKILSNSREKQISLDDELEALNLYIDIERKRLANSFNYFLKADEEIDLRSIKIPPLSLQPFVENAIWHGFLHKEGQGNLVIEIFKKNRTVKIVISDDGVGRENSRKIERNHSRNRSYGILITKERFDQILDKEKRKSSVNIEDIFNPDGSAGGTKVTISIPISNS